MRLTRPLPAPWRPLLVAKATGRSFLRRRAEAAWLSPPSSSNTSAPNGAAIPTVTLQKGLVPPFPEGNAAWGSRGLKNGQKATLGSGWGRTQAFVSVEPAPFCAFVFV